MKWTTKALIQRQLSRLPGGENVYFLGQRLAGGLRRFTINAKVRQGLNLLKAFEQTGETIAGKVVVELGTGWVPALPLLFWLVGQEKCYTFDVSRLLRPSLVMNTAAQLSTLIRAKESALTEWKGSPIQPARCQRLSELVADRVDMEALLAQSNITYQAPSNTAETGLPAASVDVFYSNAVLEHVPSLDLAPLFQEARRILRPGGYMLHQIDPSDHFAHRDKSIPVLNFLQYSEEVFARYNSRLFYQNRLRAPTYAEMVEQNGFEIVHWEVDLNEKALTQIPAMKIDPAFSTFSPKELCITGIRLVARPAVC